jgi:hypothetical protein
MEKPLSPRAKLLSDDRIFDYYLRVELKPDSTTPSKLMPEIVHVYPQVQKNVAFINHVTQFCFPDCYSTSILKKPEVYSFVVTDTAGVQVCERFIDV